MGRRFRHALVLLLPSELILLGLLAILIDFVLIAEWFYGSVFFVMVLCDAVFWIPFCLVCQWLIKKFEPRLKRHLEVTTFGLGLALAIFTLAPINTRAIVCSQAFYDWAQDHAPRWLSLPFSFKGQPWVDVFGRGVESYFMIPSLILVTPCLAIALLLLGNKARLWGKANVGLLVDSFTALLWLGSVICSVWVFEKAGQAREKPVIYLYPQTEQVVNVKFKYPGVLLHSYPAYPPDGWSVRAKPDGELADLKSQRKYYCLFWEGRDSLRYDLTTGFVVEGRNAAKFLEETLATLGLSDREANEFIIYWLPRLEKNRFNVIHFATEEYNKRVPLEITPPPDTLIRVLMVFKVANRPFDIEPQVLAPVVRRGFTVVEWGGTEVK